MPKQCSCQFCRMSRRIEKNFPQMTKGQYGVIDDLFSFWEAESTDANYWQDKYKTMESCKISLSGCEVMEKGDVRYLTKDCEYVDKTYSKGSKAIFQHYVATIPIGDGTYMLSSVFFIDGDEKPRIVNQEHFEKG